MLPEVGVSWYLVVILPEEMCRMAFARSLSEANGFRFLSWWRPAALAATLAAATGFAGCNTLSSGESAASAAAESNAPLGTGGYKVGLVLPMSATGNAGAVAQAMRNASEMAL